LATSFELRFGCLTRFIATVTKVVSVFYCVFRAPLHLGLHMQEDGVAVEGMGRPLTARGSVSGVYLLDKALLGERG
jgi:hypothetical protein